jgi:N-acetylglucosaminyl-diphospho-decaprenol L-rhamnosyltransferase
MADVADERDPLASTTVVVVNFNLPDLTIRCVRDLLEDGVDPSRIVLVENGSSEESTAALREALPDVPLLRLEENVGYARAANQGAAQLPGDRYLFVNNDAFVERPGSVPRLVASLDLDRVGVAVPRLLNEDRTLQASVVPITTPANALLRASGLSRLVPNRWQPSWGHHWNHGSSRSIRAANGAVIAVHGKLWAELGGWIERELMFAEDLDLCWRTWKRGWLVWFEAESEFVHLGNTSGRRTWSDRRRSKMIGLSEGTLIRTELPRVKAEAALFFMCAGLVVRMAFFSLKGESDARESLAGMLSGYLESG